MNTLASLIRDAVVHLGRTNYKMLKATAGSTTTIADTLVTGFSDDDDAVVNGTIIITADAGGAGAAPEGEAQRISAYSETTSQFTVDTAFTQAVAAGDGAMFINSQFPFAELKQLANTMLADLGNIALVDTSITSATGTNEYTLPVGLKYTDPIQVSYANSGANDRVPVTNFTVIPAAPGTTGKLVLRNLPDARQVYVIYNGTHPLLTTFNSVISETIDPALASWALASCIWRWKEPTDPASLQRLNEALSKEAQFKMERPIWKPLQQPHWLVIR